MSRSEQKVVQYLGEAHASEIGVLRSQIAITPRGSYRDGLEKHLAETRKHAGRIQQRLGEVHGARNPLQVIVGLTETLVSQTLAVSKPPWPGYDEITAAEIEAGSSRGDEQHAKQVVAYERAHKNRAGVLKAAERETANA